VNAFIRQKNMNKLRYISIAASLFLLFSLSGCFYSVPAEFEQSSIGGLCQDSTMKGIEGVQVTVIGTDKTAYTDSTGTFFFSELEPGSYTLNIVMQGYQQQQKNVTVQKGQSRTVVVEMYPIGVQPGQNTSMGPPTTSLDNMQNQTVSMIDPSIVHTMYVANAGPINQNPYGQNYEGGYDAINQGANSPGDWTGNATSGVDTSRAAMENQYMGYLKGADPISEAYANSLPPPTPENLRAFGMYIGKKKNNLMSVNSTTRSAISIIEWTPNVMPLWLDISDNGMLYIADSANNITVINTSANNQLVSTLAMGEYMVMDITIGNSGSRLFCALGSAGEPAVGVVDTTTNSYIKTIPLGRMQDGSIGQPWGIGAHRNGQRAYVAVGHDTGGELVCIDTLNNSVQYHVTVGQKPFGVVVSPDGRLAYVANSNSANVSIVDTATKQVVSTISVDYSPVRLAITPDGKKVFVVNKGAGVGGSVSVIDTTTNSLLSKLPVGKDPTGIAISRDGKMAYVANTGADTITMIDVARNAVVASTIPFPQGRPFDVVVK